MMFFNFRRLKQFLISLCALKYIYIYYQSETMSIIIPTWQNNNKQMSHETRYGINNNTAVSNVDIHELQPTEAIKDHQIDLYITFSTFDGEFIILQYQNQVGKLSTNTKLSFKEIVRIKTHFPIAKCHLQYRHIIKQHKDALLAYLIDIYSNIYTVNFTTYIDYYKTIGTQPIKYAQIYKNISDKYNDHGIIENIHLQTPLFIFQDNEDLYTLSLNGQLKIITYNSQKSFVKQIPEDDVQKINFQQPVLAAICQKIKDGYLMVVALHNGKTPYIFANCRSVNDFKEQYSYQNNNDYQDSIDEVTYLAYDPSTNYIVASLVSQKIELFQIIEIKKHKSQNKIFYLNRVFGFFINNNIQFSNLNIDYNIQHIHINKGILMITTCKQFIIFDIKERTIKRKLKNVNLTHFKYGKIIDKNQHMFCCALIKGFNHINQNQSKVGKPNIHFVLYQYNSKRGK